MLKTILNVEGMSCPSCIGHVSEALSIQGVQKVDVLFDQGAVAIDHDRSISVDRLISVLEGAGYEATARS